MTATQQVGIPHRYGEGWLVPSSRGDQRYLVQQHRFGWSCQCAHFAYRGHRSGTCKHIGAVLSMLMAEGEEEAIA
jgi:SWIM zinc finger